MRWEPYRPEELQFAYCYRDFFRCRTCRAKPLPALGTLTQAAAQAFVERFGLHILELSADPTDVLCLASLQPDETVAAAVSKLKGQTSKWLRTVSGCGDDDRLLSRGYSAVSTGESTTEAVDRYLQAQAEHHGYDERWARPPVLVETYPVTPDDEHRLQAAHSHTLPDGSSRWLLGPVPSGNRDAPADKPLAYDLYSRPLTTSPPARVTKAA